MIKYKNIKFGEMLHYGVGSSVYKMCPIQGVKGGVMFYLFYEKDSAIPCYFYNKSAPKFIEEPCPDELRALYKLQDMYESA